MCLETYLQGLFLGKDEPPAQTFTSFSQLPAEIRLLIWNAALLQQHRDLHAAYNIWASDWTRTKNYRLPRKSRAPVSLLKACSESRNVALAAGSFLELEDKLWFILPWKVSEPIWIDNSIKTLMMPINISALFKISRFPKSIQSVATLSASKKWTESAFLFLATTKRCHNIKTILNGLMWIPLRYSEGNDRNTHPCVDSDTATVSLDDPNMIGYLTSAFERHAVTTLKERIPPACYRKSARNFLVFNRFLKRDLLSRQQCHIPDGFELDVAIIFGRPHAFAYGCLEGCVRIMDTFVCRSEDDEDLERWDHGTQFGANGSLFRYNTNIYEK
ncbi:hypothetical protein FSPOR_3658 [Fusarium sporotrichioides]|uniref:2EXR domain-containing protein n=1 Tax=Fusarium sporotrichioides TaxID=5514 RepID=A0A395SEZ4_FUSSP|nr:hypothetical protein FSPOR_3658 [Fusarium sporotrichioides]